MKQIKITIDISTAQETLIALRDRQATLWAEKSKDRVVMEITLRQLERVNAAIDVISAVLLSNRE